MRRAALSTLLFFLGIPSVYAGSLVRIGELQIPRGGASATLLDDGRVLVAGGNSQDRRLEIFDPRTGVSSLIDAQPELPMLGHTATKLVDGRVLIAAGGYKTDGRSGFGNYGSITSDTFDAASGALIPTGTLHAWRARHTGTLLKSGKVLIAGGENVNVGGFHIYRDVTDSAEIFDPATNTFRTIASMHTRRSHHTATLLADGRVLIAAGTNDLLGAVSSMEIFDPQHETFTPVASLHVAHTDHTATLLRDGRVLIAAGDGDTGVVEIWDPATNSVIEAGSIGLRSRHTATLLPNDKVLFAGGADVVVYDPTTFEIVETRLLEHPVTAPATTLLPNGNVLLIGGTYEYSGTTDVWLYRLNESSPRRRAVGR